MKGPPPLQDILGDLRVFPSLWRRKLSGEGGGCDGGYKRHGEEGGPYKGIFHQRAVFCTTARIEDPKGRFTKGSSVRSQSTERKRSSFTRRGRGRISERGGSFPFRPGSRRQRR